MTYSPEHCAGCTGVDYLGRPCRGDERAAVAVPLDDIDVERMRRALAVVLPHVQVTHEGYRAVARDVIAAYRDAKP